MINPRIKATIKFFLPGLCIYWGCIILIGYIIHISSTFHWFISSGLAVVIDASMKNLVRFVGAVIKVYLSLPNE